NRRNRLALYPGAKITYVKGIAITKSHSARGGTGVSPARSGDGAGREASGPPGYGRRRYKARNGSNPPTYHGKRCGETTIQAAESARMLPTARNRHCRRR